MKRLFAASSAVAAATLVSAAALAGANGALASEPVRLDAAQLDVVTAGTITEKIVQSLTTITDGQSVTQTSVTIIEDGKTTFSEESVVEGLVGVELPGVAALPPGIVERLDAIAAWRIEIRKFHAIDL